MKRHSSFDPPEYSSWTADPSLVREFSARIESDRERRAVVESLGEAGLLKLYEGMVRTRLHDYALKRWVRRGIISKAWLGTGEEAVTVGAVHALDRARDVVAPMIRNAGACHEMGMSLEVMFHGYLGTSAGPNGGRDGHFGDLSKGVLQPISHVGEMVPVTAGMALAFKHRNEPRVALTWIGDGATKTGAFHEGINLAAVQQVPAIFILQNNQVALGTRLQQHQRGDFNVWPSAYGLAGAWADGNNVLDVFAAARVAAERARSGGGPTLLVVDTFRMGGHATHDEAEARVVFDAELFAYWGARDPIGLYEEYLVAHDITGRQLEQIEERVEEEIDVASEAALAARDAYVPAGESAEYDGYSTGVRQPGLATRLGAVAPEKKR